MRFQLVNPFITGTLRTSVHAPSDIKAAKKLYTRMSQYFSNNLPSFFFTLKDENGGLHHFEVNERKSGHDVNFTIRGVSMDKKGEKRLQEIVLQKGGQKKDDDSSSSSSSSSMKKSQKVRYYLSPFEEFIYYGHYYMIDGYAVQQYYFPVFPSYLVDLYPILVY